MERVQRALNALSYGSPADMERVRTVAAIPLLPGPPSWRTSLWSWHGAEAEQADRAKADAIIAKAVEDALAALDANSRAEPPRITALQVLDHYLARGEPLPPRALTLLSRTLRIDPRSIDAWHRRIAIRRADEAGRHTDKAIAAELGISDRAVRALRQPVENSDALLLYGAVAAAAERGQPPHRDVRDSIVRLLELLGPDGHWRADVVAAIHNGDRDPDLVREAARVEAKRRRDGKAENDAKQVAKLIRADHRKVQRRMERPDWEDAVLGPATWSTRRENVAFRAAARFEAWRRLEDEDGAVPNDAVAIAADQGIGVHIVQGWIERPDWKDAVRANMDRLQQARAYAAAMRNLDADQ